MPSHYEEGDLVHIAMALTTSSDVAIDPTVFTVKVRDPSSNVATYVYGSDGAFARDSTGGYHIDIDADESGDWFVRAFSTGTGQAAAETTFRVTRSNI